MPNTTYGSPYAQSSDLVSNWPGVSLNVADRLDDVSFKGNGLNDQTGTSYTLVLTDAGKTVTLNNASAVTVTIPTNASVAYEDGTGVTLINKGAGVVTVVAAGGVTLTGESLTINQNQAATLRKLATNTWVMVKGGGLPKASYSATTGSPTITTVSGKTCVQFTGSGSITVDAGTLDILVVGGGGGGGSGRAGGGGGGGGVLYLQTVYLAAGTHTVTVGAGGAGGVPAFPGALQSCPGANGGTSSVGPYYGVGGGGGSTPSSSTAGNSLPVTGQAGGSGSGGCWGNAGGAGTTNQGNSGGSSTLNTGRGSGGGGGATAVGATGTTTAGGNGGAGSSNSITGTATVYGSGGGGGGEAQNGATTAGTGGTNAGNGSITNAAAGSATPANRGAGGGGSGYQSNTVGNGGNGSSGIVILLFG